MPNHRILIALLSFLVFSAGAAQAQGVDVTFTVVDQDGDEFAGAYVRVNGVGNVDTGDSIELDEDTYTVYVYPLAGLQRSELIEVTATTTSFEFEWITSTVTIDIVDEDGDPIDASEFKIDGMISFTETPFDLTLPITDETVYLTMWGSLRVGYFTRLFPGANGLSWRGISRSERFEVAESTTAVDFEWITQSVTIDIVDQDGDSIDLSEFKIDGIISFTETPFDLTLVITDETVYPSLSSGAKDGYFTRLFPGVNGRSWRGITRSERFEVTESTTAVDFEWITQSVTIDIVDQDGDAIPSSKFKIDGVLSLTDTSFDITLPITDEAVYPSMTGGKDGYFTRIFPGLNGLAPLGVTRSERFEVTETTTAVDFEWITQSVTVDVVDQDGVAIDSSRFKIDGVLSLTDTPYDITLPITDETVYPSMTGGKDGYPARVFPAIDGTAQGLSTAISLSRWERFEVSSGQTTHDFEWVVVDCSIHVVDADGDILSGSSFKVYGYTYDTGDALVLPITDNSVYPYITGVFANGYSVVLMPGDTTEYGTFQFELNPAGIFEPDFVNIDGSMYGLRCQLNEPPAADAGDNVSILGEDQSTTTITGSASDPDGDLLEYRWLEGTSVHADWADVETDGDCPLDLGDLDYFTLGQHVLTLEVYDGTVTVSDTMVLQVDNSPPFVSCPGQMTVAVWTSLDLNAEVSDHDGDTLSWSWTENDVEIAGGTIDASDDGTPSALPATTIADGLSLGLHEITLTVDDGENDAVICVVLVDVIDTEAPTMAPVASPAILWPPNHKMVDVEIETNAADNEGGSVTITVEQITSSEDPDKDGDGNTVPDWILGEIDQDTGIVNLELRSERSGKGPGRTYTITITATDSSGNKTTLDVTVVAPHSKKK